MANDQEIIKIMNHMNVLFKHLRTAETDYKYMQMQRAQYPDHEQKNITKNYHRQYDRFMDAAPGTIPPH